MIYRKLIKLQAYLQEYPLATHQEMLAHVDFAMGKLYAKTREKYSIMDGLHHIYSISLGESLQSVLTQSTEGFHTVASRLIYQASSRQKRELTVSEALEELLLEIDWPMLSEASSLLEALGEAPLTAPTELLHQLITKNKLIPSLASFLLNRGAQLGTVVELRGYNILHTAARHCSCELLSLFLNAGADINAIDENGETPLDKLVKETHPPLERIEFLLQRGAKTTAPYKIALQEIETLIRSNRVDDAGYPQKPELKISSSSCKKSSFSPFWKEHHETEALLEEELVANLISDEEALEFCQENGIEGFKAIARDGNCFFHAVLAALPEEQPLNQPSEGCQQLREQAVQYMRNNPERSHPAMLKMNH